MLHRPLSVLLAIELVASPCALIAQAKPPAIPADLFVKPAGPYAVGMQEVVWTDAKRGEPFTKDPSDKRRVTVRIWYPAQASASLERAPWITPAEFGDSSGLRAVQHVRTNALLNAPLATAQSKWPVLIYQPGGGTSRIAGTFEAEQLASHGYVVVGEEHPGFSYMVAYPDGSKYKPDTLLAPPVTTITREAIFANWEWLDKDVFPTWTADASFLIDELEKLNRASGQPLAGHLDVSKIGMYGWSFGGATSIAMSIADPRVKAAIDQDGQLFGVGRTKGTSKPVMLMHHGGEDQPPTSDAAPLWKQMIDTVGWWDRHFVQQSTGPVYDMTIGNTQHGHFSDLTLVYPHPPDQLDPRRAHDIIVAYTEAFFDKYLLGRDSPLLAGPSPSYSEVTFKRLR